MLTCGICIEKLKIRMRLADTAVLHDESTTENFEKMLADDNREIRKIRQRLENSIYYLFNLFLIIRLST